MIPESFKGWLLQPTLASRFALTLTLAVIVAGFNVVNSTLFAWAKDGDFTYYIWLPAGLRLLIIMLFGWLGVLAVTLGFFFAHTPVTSGSLNEAQLLLLGFVRAVSVYGALWAYGKITNVKFPWNYITWTHIPFLALITTLVNQVAFHSVHALLSVDRYVPVLRNIALAALSNMLGVLVFLALAILMRRSYLAYQKTEASEG
jgi:hypothetical protein